MISVPCGTGDICLRHMEEQILFHACEASISSADGCINCGLMICNPYGIEELKLNLKNEPEYIRYFL